MKTLVNHSDKAIKIAVEMTGDITVTLPGGETVKGKLTTDELEQFAFRLTAMSEGKISFDPPANDLIAVHFYDVETLEKQALLLEQQREEIYLHVEAVAVGHKTIAELNQRLEDCEKDLVEARGNLKDSREAMSIMQEKIELYESAVSEREAAALVEASVIEATSESPIVPAETVHNERSDKDTEPPSAPVEEISTVHNERPPEYIDTQAEEMPLL